MATTFDFTTDGAAGALPCIYTNQRYLVRKLINIPELIISLNSGTAFAAADILQVFDIPANTWINNAFALPHVVEGAACTIDLGITGDDADGLINDANLNTLVIDSSHYTGVALGYGANTLQGKFVSAADTIDIYFNSADTDTAIFSLFVEMTILTHDYVAEQRST